MGVVIYPVRTGTSQGSGALFYDSAALFPVIGAEGVLYVDASTSESYIWTGSAYDLSFDIAADIAAHVAELDPHTQYATDAAVSADVSSAISAHLAVVNPHGNPETLENLHDVNASAPADKDILYYSSSMGRWINKSSEEILGGILYLTLIDEIDDTTTYIGEAGPASGTDEEVWRIRRITTTGNDVAIEFADGTRDFVNIWDDREGYTYF